MTNLAVARGRIEIFHTPIYFDDHLASGWSSETVGPTFDSDGDVGMLDLYPDQTTGNMIKTFSAINPSGLKLIVRINAITGGTWGLKYKSGSTWYDIFASQTTSGLFDSYTFNAAVTSIVGLKFILAGTAQSLEVDLIAICSNHVVPLNAPDDQDTLGDIVVNYRLNKSSSAEFRIDNTPSAFNGTGPYNSLISNKDKVIIWVWRDGDDMEIDHKIFGGIITNITKKGTNTAEHSLNISCMDHGWELLKPPTMVNDNYSNNGSGTLGKTILTDAANHCSYLSGAYIDYDDDIVSLHNVDYSGEGKEVTPYKVFEEIAPRCQDNGGITGCDWYVSPSGMIFLEMSGTMGSASPAPGDTDMEDFEREEDWWRCFNYQKVYGAVIDTGTEMANPSKASFVQNNSAAGQSNLSVNDTTPFAANDAIFIFDPTPGAGFGETNEVLSIDAANGLLVVKTALANNYGTLDIVMVRPGWSRWDTHVTISDETTIVYEGEHSVKVAVGSNGAGGWVFKPGSLLDFSTGHLDRYSVMVQPTGNSTGNITMWDSAYKEAIISYGTLLKDVWNLVQLIPGSIDPTGWTIDSGFDWSEVIAIEWMCDDASTTYYIDNTSYGRQRYLGLAQDNPSQTSYGILTAEPVTDDVITSDNECYLKALSILTQVKTPPIIYKALRLPNGQLYEPGHTLSVTSTTPAISDSIIIQEVTQRLSKVDWETTLQLSSVPVEIDYLFKLIHEKAVLAMRAAGSGGVG